LFCSFFSEQEQIENILSKFQHELFSPTFSLQTVTKRVREKACYVAYALGIDKQKLTETWLANYVLRFQHLFCTSARTCATQKTKNSNSSENESVVKGCQVNYGYLGSVSIPSNGPTSANKV